MVLSPVRSRNGFTLIEVIVVIAILAVLLILAMSNAPVYLSRARDGERKSNLQELKIAIEQYYADKQCYPPVDTLDVCNSVNSVLAPYIKKIPCDPISREPYFYIPNGCTEFRLYTTLENATDPGSEKIGCGDGCGLDQDGNGVGDDNYGVGSENANVGITFSIGLCGGGCPVPGSGACCPGGYVCDSNKKYCIKQ